MYLAMVLCSRLCKAGCVLHKVFHMCLVPQSSGYTSLQPLQLGQKCCSRRDDLPLGETFHGTAWVPLQTLCRALHVPSFPKAVCVLPASPLLPREAAAMLSRSRVCAAVTLRGEGASICPLAKGFCFFPAELWYRQS